MTKPGTIGYVALVLSLSLLFICPELKAQQQADESTEDSVYTAILPVAAYDSDIGLLGGAFFNRIDYRGGLRPFNTYLTSSVTASTKGMFSAQVEYEKTQAFGSDLRSRIDGVIYRFIHDYYFGIGNDTGFDRDLFDDRFYFFESFGFLLQYELRWPLHAGLDFVAGVGSRYEMPTVHDDDSMFNLNRPRGFGGGWVNVLKTGLVWENRSNEFSPTSGNRLELSLRAAPEFLFSEFGLVAFYADYRHYIRLFNWMTLATRAQLRHAEGDVPYWEMSRLGDDETLRGYPLNRFLGNSSVAATLELRKWLIEFPDYDIRLGGHFFTDVGRVFTEADDIGDLLGGYKQTIGLGGVVSLFSPDLILRGEVGFSDELMRVYAGIGYTF